MNDVLKFKAKIDVRGINPYVHISAKRAAVIKANWRRPMPVLVQVNRKPNPAWEINMMPAGHGEFYLYLHKTVRLASNTKVGDMISIELKFHDKYVTGPQHPLPNLFQELLKNSSKAHMNWDKLSPSRKKEILRNFRSLKSEDARNRNIYKAIYVLEGNKTRFMARNWEDGK